jgi:hypothetical protein
MRSGPDAIRRISSPASTSPSSSTQIETGPAVRDQQRGDLRLLHADAHPVTGNARLRHFEQSAADPVTVADVDLLVRQAVDGEVLPELPIGEVVSTELA